LTKYFNAQVAVVQAKTIRVQVAAENEAEAIARAKETALVKEPGFRATDVQLEFVGQSQMEVGLRVVHSIFGPGQIEALYPTSAGPQGNMSFRIKVKFDRGDTKEIHAPHSSLRPESF
jgi:hypothetical protein